MSQPQTKYSPGSLANLVSLYLGFAVGFFALLRGSGFRQPAMPIRRFARVMQWGGRILMFCGFVGIPGLALADTQSYWLGTSGDFDNPARWLYGNVPQTGYEVRMTLDLDGEYREVEYIPTTFSLPYGYTGIYQPFVLDPYNGSLKFTHRADPRFLGLGTSNLLETYLGFRVGEDVFYDFQGGDMRHNSTQEIIGRLKISEGANYNGRPYFEYFESGSDGLVQISGLLELNGGNLYASVLVAGNGSTADPGFTMTSGNVQLDVELDVGANDSAGAVRQTGGKIETPTVRIGTRRSSLRTSGAGSYFLGGTAELDVATETVVGYSASGSFTQSGTSTHTTAALRIGGSGNGSGTYLLSGGVLTVSGATEIGVFGSGSLTQTGGIFTTSTLSFGSGSYSIQGGSVTVDNSISLGGASLVTLNLLGGTSLFRGDIAVGNGRINVSGGTHTLLGTLSMETEAPTEYNGYVQTAGSFAVGGDVLVTSSMMRIDGETAYLGVQDDLIVSGTDPSFHQANGQVVVGSELIIGADPGESGQYTFQGGTLNAGAIVVGRDATGVFTIDGTGTITTPVFTLADYYGDSGTLEVLSGASNLVGKLSVNYPDAVLAISDGASLAMDDFDLATLERTAVTLNAGSLVVRDTLTIGVFNAFYGPEKFDYYLGVGGDAHLEIGTLSLRGNSVVEQYGNSTVEAGDIQFSTGLAQYLFSGGTLDTNSVTLTNGSLSKFLQTGGEHVIAGALTIERGSYEMDGENASLIAESMNVSGQLNSFVLNDGEVLLTGKLTNSGTISIQGGVLQADWIDLEFPGSFLVGAEAQIQTRILRTLGETYSIFEPGAFDASELDAFVGTGFTASGPGFFAENVLADGGRINFNNLEIGTGGEVGASLGLVDVENALTVRDAAVRVDGGRVQATSMTIGEDGRVYVSLGGVETQTLIIDEMGLFRLTGGNIDVASVDVQTGGTFDALDNLIQVGSAFPSSPPTVAHIGQQLVSTGNIFARTLNVKGTGTVQIDGGILEITDFTNIVENGSIDLNGGTLRTGGVGFASDSLNWNAGVLHVTNEDFLIGSSATWGTNLALGTGKTLLVDGALELQVGGNLSMTGGTLDVASLAAIQNSGQDFILGGGTVDVSGDFQYDGVRVVTPGAKFLQISNGTMVDVGGDFRVGTWSRVSQSGGSIVDVGGTLTLGNEEWHETEYLMQGTFGSRSTLTTGRTIVGGLGIASFRQFSETDHVTGELIVAQAAGSSGSYTLASGATLGADVVQIGQSGTFTSTNGAITVANAFENAGIYSQTSGSLHSGSISNSGLFTAMDSLSGVPTISGELDNSGDFIVNTPNKSLTVLGTGLIHHNTGTLLLMDNSTIGFQSQFENDPGGRIEGIGGLGTAGNQQISDYGTLAPGQSPGQLTIYGDYTQYVGGILEMEIAGRSPSLYDRISVSIAGSARFYGSLNVNFINGFAAVEGDVFTLVSGADLFSFSGVQVTGLDPSLTWNADTSNGVYRFQIVAIPEPATTMLLLIGLIGVFAVRSRKRRLGKTF